MATDSNDGRRGIGALLRDLAQGSVALVRDEVTLANAGHPPPLRVRADGSTEQLAVAEDVLLGVGPVERV